MRQYVAVAKRRHLARLVWSVGSVGEDCGGFPDARLGYTAELGPGRAVDAPEDRKIERG